MRPYVRYSVSARRTPSTVIDDYAATAGKRPKEPGTTQRGDVDQMGERQDPLARIPSRSFRYLPKSRGHVPRRRRKPR